MKANELMIGDFVRTAKDVCFSKGTIVQVRNIDGDNRFLEKNLIGCATCIPIDNPDKMSWGVWVEYLEPIPLTPEILEKNGFDYNDLPFVQGWQQFGLTLYRGGKGYLINCGENVAMVVNYVHQLQHALRICGIDKEITLT